MGLIDDEGQGITPETLSRSERKQYEYAKRQAQKCENLHQIEAYAYANLVKGFSECLITGDNPISDTDITLLSTFSDTFDSADLPAKTWDDVSEEQFCNTHKLFRTPWIARAADALGSERFYSLALQAIAATRDIVVEQASYCDEDLAFLGWHERESLVHEEMLKHYPRFAEAFHPYPPDEDDYDYEDWAAEESIKVAAAAAYAANHVATIGPCASNPGPTPRRQTGGSDSDDSASDDHDSHVQAYLHCVKYPRLICWTSALEVVTAAIPATKTIQKHIRYIGNRRLDLSDCPANFLPDYTFHTLIRAAIEVGYTANQDALESALKSTVGTPSHPLWQMYGRFERPLLPTSADDAKRVAQDAHQPLPDDLTMRMKILDPDGRWYAIGAKRMALRLLAGWERDPTYDDMCDHVVSMGYTRALKSFNPLWPTPFATYLWACIRTALREAIKSTHMYETSAVISGRVADTLLPALLSIRVDKCIDPVGTQQMIASVANYLTRTQDPVEDLVRVSYDAVKQMIAELRGRVPEARQHALLEDIEDAIVGMARGYRVVPTESMNINPDDPDDRQYYLSDIQDDDVSRAPAEVLERKNLSTTVEYLLNALEDGQMRDVYISKHVYEMKTGEISDLYGLTQDKVRNYLRKAQAILSQAAAARNICREDYY